MSSASVTAGEMFLYLNTCPDSPWFKSWSSFYKNLFLTQQVDQIILTLNRMMKTETSQDKDGKLRAEKLLKRSTRLLSLEYEMIQSLLTEKESRNESAFLIPNGTMFSDFNRSIFHFFQTLTAPSSTTQFIS